MSAPGGGGGTPSGGGGLGGIFGSGSIAEQFLLWGVLQQVLQPLMAPLIVELQKLVFDVAPDAPLDAGTFAGLLARKLVSPERGTEGAKDTGIGEQQFGYLTDAAQSAPDFSTVFELFRRKLIDIGTADPHDVSVLGALTDAGMRPGWHDQVIKLAVQIPTVAEVMNAWLEGQIERPEALKRYLEAGGDPTWFQTSYNANGQAPTPDQALELLNRGIIPERGIGPDSTSYEQAFLEGPWRNKWLESFIALRYYYPPPRTVTAMYHSGQLTHDQAATYLAKQGLDPTLVAAYLKPADHVSTAAQKHLAKGDLLTAYTDRLITRTQAHSALVTLGYSDHDAGLLLDLADVKLTTGQLRAQVGRVRSMFQAGKLNRGEAIGLLDDLHVPHDQGVQLVDEWAVTGTSPVKLITASQAARANHYGLLDGPSAMMIIEADGYDEFDAWLILSIENHGPITDVARPRSPYSPAPPPPPPPGVSGPTGATGA